MSGVSLEWIDSDDARMAEVHVLRYEALFAPFGLSRDDGWDDEGQDRRHLVALVDGGVCGYVCLLLDCDGGGHIRQVSVSPLVQKRGIGRALMVEAEAEGARMGLQPLWLNARVTAEPFYHRLGWSTVSGTFPSGRTGVPHVRMEKHLMR